MNFSSLSADIANNVAAVARAKKRAYVPHEPTDRQKLFLIGLHDHLEAFYGGAAGGGKSDALLACALEYVDTPGYSALLLRRTYQDLAKPGALMDRARQWLQPFTLNGSITWNEQKKQFRWRDSGAVLSFGYLENEADKYQYQSAEYQFIGFDELTQFSETQYTYLFSRLRRLSDSNIPIRMRAASNPADEPTGYWVAERFVPDDFTPDDADEPIVLYKQDKNEDGETVMRAFVPARMTDNPYLDQVEYSRSLSELDDVTREQLKRGDWRIKRRGNIFSMWNELYHVISWSEFERVFGVRHIPYHWQCGISQDWGTTKSHPCVTTLFATAAENSPLPGVVFIPWALTLYDAQNAQQVANDYLIPALDKMKLRDRLMRWWMSHEANSERNSYHQLGLPFYAWGQDACGGLDPVRRHLQIRSKHRLNPFGKKDAFGQPLYGCPMLLFVVDDDQLQYPKDDRGLARHRAEAAGYSWHLPKAGDPPEKLRPQKLFNDAMDTIRCYAEIEFPQIEPMTASERATRWVDGHLPNDAVAAMPAEAQIYGQMSRDLLTAERVEVEQRSERSWIQNLEGWPD